MARTGRPKSDNPKSNRVVIRLTDTEYSELMKYAKAHKLTITETIRKGIRSMLESKQ